MQRPSRPGIANCFLLQQHKRQSCINRPRQYLIQLYPHFYHCYMAQLHFPNTKFTILTNFSTVLTLSTWQRS